MIPSGEVGTVTAGTGEFDGLAGNYTEAWTVAAVDEDGRLSGTIEINTDHESAAMKTPLRRDRRSDARRRRRGRRAVLQSALGAVSAACRTRRTACCTTPCRIKSSSSRSARMRSLFGQDTGEDSLWEETIDRTAVLGLVLNDAANQPAALASRLMATSAETDLLLRGVLVSDHWLVTIPSEGTLFVRADSNAWPFLKKRLCPSGISTGRGTAPRNTGRRSAPARTRAASRSASRARSAAAKAAPSSTTRSRLSTPRASVALAKAELHLTLAGPQVAAQ